MKPRKRKIDWELVFFSALVAGAAYFLIITLIGVLRCQQPGYREEDKNPQQHMQDNPGNIIETRKAQGDHLIKITA